MIREREKKKISMKSVILGTGELSLWLRTWKLSQRSQVQLPAPASGSSQLPAIPDSEGPEASRLYEYYAHMHTPSFR